MKQAKVIMVNLLAALLCCGTLAAGDLTNEFVHPPASAKPWVFMFWLGKTTPADVTRHMEELKAKGIGGFILFDLGGMPGVPFISDPWRELFRHTVREADRLGLQMGVNVCSRWPAGGPWITPENSSWMVVSSETVIQGPQNFSGKLAEPSGKGKLYADVAVQAFPMPGGDSISEPVVTLSTNSSELPNLLDGNFNTGWHPGTNGNEWILVDFKKPHVVDWAWIDMEGTATIESSEDGSTFKPLTTLNGPRWNLIYEAIPRAEARWFRVKVPAITTVVRDFALGTRAEVERTAQLAAKRALSNPLGVTATRQADQVDFVRKDLVGLPTDRPLKLQGMVDLTDRISPDGTLKWEAPPGTWKIIRIGRRTTGIPAGGGLLTDYLSEAATEQNFEKALNPLIDDAGSLVGKTFQYFHEDNVEISGLYSWTPKLIEEFRKRRGYDPTPYLSAMAGEIVRSIETTDRFLTDMRRTMADCVADWHYGRWAELAHAKGMKVRAEAGGQHHPRLLCSDGLMNQGRMDVPVGEFWENEFWKENQWSPINNHTLTSRGWDEAAQNVNVKQTASAAHLYGKRLVATESFTSGGKRAAWGVAPADLLLYANIAFCEGVNAITIHGSVTQDPQNGKPGNAYAGTHFNPNVTWWNQSGPFLDYLARCQHLLRQGLFVADVLYYNGDEVPNFVPPKHIDPSRGFGYDYDVCNTEILLTRLSVKDGRIVLPDGMSYRVLVLPDRPVMPLAVMEKIAELVTAGATVIGPKPQRTTGLTGYPQSEQRLKEIANQLWGSEPRKSNDMKSSSVQRQNGKGRVVDGLSIREVLSKDGVSPDFTFLSQDSHALVDFIHRREGDTEIYFVVNRRSAALAADCSFRVSGKQPELWDPVTGEERSAAAFKQADGQTTLPLELPPYGSMFVVFQKPMAGDGKARGNFASCSTLQTLDGKWTVQFDSKWGGPDQPVAFETLQDWTKRPEAGIKYYSGTATYRKQFDLASRITDSAGRVFLDLGGVKNVAEVRLNGKKLGIVWCAPWRIEVSDELKSSGNVLEIDVINLWPNRLIGDSKLPPEKRYTKTNLNKFYLEEHPLLESGLLGPVQLLLNSN